jgi:hypothetical protein
VIAADRIVPPAANDHNNAPLRACNAVITPSSVPNNTAALEVSVGVLAIVSPLAWNHSTVPVSAASAYMTSSQLQYNTPAALSAGDALMMSPALNDQRAVPVDNSAYMLESNEPT